MTLIIKIRLLTLFFIVVLILSGVTAFPVETELHWLLNHLSLVPNFADAWLQDVYNALLETNTKYPKLAYGFDWLAFAHIVIALAFIGPLKNPVKNKWIIDWAMLACIAIFPLVFIDCSFGIIGLIPLYFYRKWIRQLEGNKIVN